MQDLIIQSGGGGGGGATLKTNGVTNSTQSLLNLANGSGISITESAGTVTIGNSGVASGIWTAVNQTANRAVNTVYQNTSGFPMIVHIAAGGSSSNANLLCDASNPPTTSIYAGGFQGSGFGADFYGIVLNNQFYKLSGTFASMSNWTEYTITKGSITDSGNLVGSRAFGTAYQNTSGSLMWVMMQATFTSGSGTVWAALSDASNPPTTQVAIQTIGGVTINQSSLLIPVLPGHYYKFTATGGSGATLTSLREYTHTTVTATRANVASGRTISTLSASPYQVQQAYVNPFSTKCIWWQISQHASGTSSLIAKGDVIGSSSIGLPPITGVAGVSANGTSQRTMCFGTGPGESYMPYADGGGSVIDNWFEWYLS